MRRRDLADDRAEVTLRALPKGAKADGMAIPPPYPVDRLLAPENALSRRWARLVDVPETTKRLRGYLEAHGPPLGYDVFGTRFSLGDDEIGFVIAWAEADTILVATSERAWLRDVAIHQAPMTALHDFLGRIAAPDATDALARSVLVMKASTEDA